MTKGWINMVVAIAAVALGGCETVPTGGVGRGVAALPASPTAGPAETAVLFARARAAEVEPRIHSIIALDPTAIAQARAIDSAGRVGPLAGKPILLKDNIESAGPLPTTAGSLALKDNVTGRDAPLVSRLRSAGAIILGKSNLSEWANIRDTKSISGWSAVGGQTRNP
ncbi:MAG TPA: amidase family protein, partial [Sphingomicrobium sp.]|nr:amidase family protein [Sphingomicrobium sp.]